MKKEIFRGAGCAIVTPMFEDGRINYKELARLIDFQVDNGTDAIIICGTTGEASTLSDEEHIACIRFAVESVNHRVPVVAGVGSNDTAYAVWLSKEAKQVGADALLHVSPYYNKASQTGLVRHYNAIADATDLPIIVYSVPSRTSVTFKPTTYAELAKHPNIVALKEASGDISAIAHTRALCGDDLDLYSGNDDQIVPLMSLGGKGVISVLSNICPRETHDMCRLYLDGKVKESAALQLDYMELVAAIFSDVNPIPVKQALNFMGFAAGPCRLPLDDMSAAGKQHLREVLVKYRLVNA